MSAKRGSDTLQLSVADGRALLTGLLTGLAPPAPARDPLRMPTYDPTTGQMVMPDESAQEASAEGPGPLEPLVDLRIPLPKALAALTAARTAGPAGNFASSSAFQQKPLRPVLVGASGPFARAAREEGTSYGGGGGSGSVSSGGSSRSRRRCVCVCMCMCAFVLVCACFFFFCTGMARAVGAGHRFERAGGMSQQQVQVYFVVFDSHI